jgi:hypothetical protein
LLRRPRLTQGCSAEKEERLEICTKAEMNLRKSTNLELIL